MITQTAFTKLKDYGNSLSVFCISCIIIGLFTSRALVSISIAALLVSMFMTTGRLKQWKDLVKQQWALAVLVFLFFADFFSGIYSDNSGQWVYTLWNKLPFLIIPLAFIQLRMTRKMWHALLSLFFLGSIVSSVVVLINYGLHYTYYNYTLSLGQPIPMPHNHIRYSVLLSFSVVLGIYLFNKRVRNIWKWETGFWLAGSIFLFLTLHIISVRTGLLSVYVALSCYAILYAVQKKRWFWGILMLGIIISAPFVAYKTAPSFKNRIDYMKWDIHQYQSEKISYDSDSRRIRSYEIGWKIIKDYFPWGTGVGDYMEVVDQYYTSYYPEIEPQNRKYPHNQWIWVAGTSGILGVLFTLVAVFIPLFWHRKDVLLVSLLSIISIAVFTDTFFEDQIGIAFTALMCGLVIKGNMLTSKGTTTPIRDIQ